MKTAEEMTAELWGDFNPSPPPTYCAYGRQFKVWVDALCAAVAQDVQQNGAGAVVAVNQAKVLLVDKLFEWQAAAPKAHRNYTGEGHTCILRVFSDCYRALKAFELSLTPPLLLLPPAPPRRAPRTLSIADVVSFGAVLPETPHT
jgi:hypothetical protein